MGVYRVYTIDELKVLYNVLRERYPEREIRVTLKSGYYIVELTDAVYTRDPEVPVVVDIQVVYGDTDSIMVRFGYNRNDFKLNRIDTFKLATLAGNKLTREVFARPPIEMEFEKVFQPFILLTKKRYIANKYENVKDPFQLKGLDAKGVALTRRDYAPLVKKCYKQIINTLLSDEKDAIDESMKVYKKYVEQIDRYQVDVEDLIVSAQIGKEYMCNKCKTKVEWILKCGKCKEPNHMCKVECGKCKWKFTCLHQFSLGHINLAQRMLQRKDSISVGDRIQYIFVEVPGKGAIKSDLAEDPRYAQEHQLPFNRMCYLEQVAKPILGFYKIVLKNRQDDLDDLIDFTNRLLASYGGKRLRPSDFKDVEGDD
ncbi:hypothetical protein EB118_06315 [bacterium]|nr:hypothetical protein [bacterium]NDD83084.1 hypothetical protein [bacterium]NDG29692.1 hypothetical protein [bacterium]